MSSLLDRMRARMEGRTLGLTDAPQQQKPKKTRNVVRSNRWDERSYAEARKNSPHLNDLITDLMDGDERDQRDEFDAAPELVKGVFQTLYKAAPQLERKSYLERDVYPAHRIVKEIMEHPRIRELQDSTMSDALLSTIAVDSMSDELREIIKRVPPPPPPPQPKPKRVKKKKQQPQQQNQQPDPNQSPDPNQQDDGDGQDDDQGQQQGPQQGQGQPQQGDQGDPGQQGGDQGDGDESDESGDSQGQGSDARQNTDDVDPGTEEGKDADPDPNDPDPGEEGDEDDDEYEDDPDFDPNSEEAMEQAEAEWQDEYDKMLDDLDLDRALNKAIDEAEREVSELEDLRKGIGLEDGEWQSMSPQERLKMAERLRTPEMRELAQVIGRMKRFASAVKATRVVDVPHEAFDVEMGNDLRRVLRPQLALLATPETTYEFMRRYTDKELLQYKMRGTEEVGKGPIVVCIDKSYSMAGKPFHWAMGVAEALRRFAAEEDRNYHAIFFGTNDDRARFEFPEGKGPFEKVMAFLGTVANGGTQFDGVLTEAMEKATKEYDDDTRGKADIVFITDGQANLTDKWIEEFNAERERTGVRVYSVYIGGARDMSTKTGPVGLLNRFSDATLQVADLKPEAMRHVFERV